MDKITLLFVSLLAVSGSARAENDPEYQKCTVYGADVHNFIDCLVSARDEWDKKSNKTFEKVLAKLNDAQRKPFYALAKKHVEDRKTKCGDPNPSTTAGAECQRAVAKDQYAEFEKAAAPVLK